MLTCPLCKGSYRVLTSTPISKDIREYYCDCKACGCRFRQLAVFDEYLVENKSSQPPDEKIQPDVAHRRQQLIKRLTPPEVEEKKEAKPRRMVFKTTHKQ